MHNATHIAQTTELNTQLLLALQYVEYVKHKWNENEKAIWEYNDNSRTTNNYITHRVTQTNVLNKYVCGAVALAALPLNAGHRLIYLEISLLVYVVRRTSAMLVTIFCTSIFSLRDSSDEQNCINIDNDW